MSFDTKCSYYFWVVVEWLEVGIAGILDMYIFTFGRH